VLCCLPLGIVSIIKANEVNKLWAQGYYQEAQEAADSAKKWAIWGALSPVIIIGIIMIVGFVIAAVNIASTGY
jgi:hypothetical protein